MNSQLSLIFAYKPQPLNTINFNDWVDEHSDYLYNYAFAKTNQKELSEDFVQDTFLAAYTKRDEFKGNSAPITWLVSILKNKIIDYYRQKNVLTQLNQYIDETNESFENSIFNQRQPGTWNHPIDENYFSNSSESYLLGEEFQVIIANCLQLLPENLKQVFISKYIDDNKSDIICKEYSISSSNYWVIIHRSKILMRNCLEKRNK